MMKKVIKINFYNNFSTVRKVIIEGMEVYGTGF